MSLIAQVQAPEVDLGRLSPLIALVVGANVVLLAGSCAGRECSACSCRCSPR